MSRSPVPPYGGVLVRALADPARRDEILRDAREQPHWTLTAPQTASLELLLSGAYSPLAGFMSSADAARCREAWQLADGTVWPVPVTLDVDAPTATVLAPGDRLVLREAEGRALAVQHVSEVWSDGSSVVRVAGRVEGLRAPTRYDFGRVRLTPEQVRQAIADRRWPAVLAVFAPGLQLGADGAALASLADDIDAGVVLFAVDEGAGPVDLRQYRRIQALDRWVAARPAGRALLCVLPQPEVAALERAVLLHGIIARNYGCSHLVTGPRAAGRDEAASRAMLEALDVRVKELPVRDAARDESAGRPGAAVFFTGLSGAGKSTIANALRVRLLEAGRQVSLLDGDLVRQHLSSELGFSREHRALNVRRIAFVAAEVARHGGIAICAPIAPYEAERREARAIVEAAGAFVLVYVDTPIEVCEARDPKGLYARARAGLVPSFTGVSDPYEVPEDPQLIVHAAEGSPEAAVDQIVAFLEARGLM
jgi:sulfate adenylyltransferase